jgi:hypothetical protein
VIHQLQSQVAGLQTQLAKYQTLTQASNDPVSGCAMLGFDTTLFLTY